MNGAAEPNGRDPEREVARAAERLAASRREIERGLTVEHPGPILQVVGPVAREHPWALAAASAAAGALLVGLRPWRWLPPPAVLTSLLSQVALNALQQRSRAPRDGRQGEHGTDRRRD